MGHLRKALAVSSLTIAAFAFGSDDAAFAQEAVFLTDEATTCEIFAHISLDVPSECLEASGGVGGMKTRGITIDRDVGDQTSDGSTAEAVRQSEAIA